MSILVIDNTEHGVLGSRLTQCGVNVLLAASAQELVEMISSARAWRAVVVYRPSAGSSGDDLLAGLPCDIKARLTVFVVGRAPPPALQGQLHAFAEPLDFTAFSNLVTRSMLTATGRPS